MAPPRPLITRRPGGVDADESVEVERELEAAGRVAGEVLADVGDHVRVVGIEGWPIGWPRSARVTLEATIVVTATASADQDLA